MASTILQCVPRLAEKVSSSMLAIQLRAREIAGEAVSARPAWACRSGAQAMAECGGVASVRPFISNGVLCACCQSSLA